MASCAKPGPQTKFSYAKILRMPKVEAGTLSRSFYFSCLFIDGDLRYEPQGANDLPKCDIHSHKLKLTWHI